MAEANPAWLDVLDQIERSLSRSLEQTPEPPAATHQPSETLARFDERLSRWRDRLDSVEATALSAEEALAAEHAAAAEYRDGLARVRAALEGWVRRGGESPAPTPATAAASMPCPRAT